MSESSTGFNSTFDAQQQQQQQPQQQLSSPIDTDHLPAHVISRLQQLEASLTSQQQLCQQLESARRAAQERVEQLERETTRLKTESEHRRQQPEFEYQRSSLHNAARSSAVRGSTGSAADGSSQSSTSGRASATAANSSSTPSTPHAATVQKFSLAQFPELAPLYNPSVSDHHKYTAARIYLYDSLHCRSIKHSTDLVALSAYQFIHISKWKVFVRWVGWIHLLLGFIEPPSTILIDGERYGPSHAVSGALELCAFSVYAFHAFKQYQAYGTGKQGFWRSPWRCVKVVFLLACVIDIIISMARNSDDPAVHLSQILRVFFVLEQSGRMRQLCSCIIKSLPAILSIMFLCLVHVLAFGTFGYFFIGPLEQHSTINSNNLYYSSLTRSFQSTFVMLTSVNFPSVMLTSYRQHWFVCIYFVCFVVIGLYGLLQLTIAVVFYTFRQHTTLKLQRSLHHRKRALEACFVLLAESTDNKEPSINLQTWKTLMATVRPDWSATQSEILFHAAMDQNDAVVLNAPENQLKFPQFEQIIQFTQNTFRFLPPVDSSATALDVDARVDAKSSKANGRATSHWEEGISMTTINKSELASDTFTGIDAKAVESSSSTIASPTSKGGFDPKHLSAFWSFVFRYYTYRVGVSDWILHLMGRNGAFIRKRIQAAKAEGEAESETAPARTPLQPPVSVRGKLTSFSLCEAVTDFLTILHALFLALHIILEDEGTFSVGDSKSELLEGLIVTIEVFFALEVLSKVYLCRKKFFKSKLQFFDLLCLILVWVAQILVFSRSQRSASDAVSAMRFCRMFRLYHRLSSFMMLITVISQVGPALAALFGVLFMLLYIYSMIGMMFFCNNLMLGKLDTHLDYHQGDFYALNFNDLGHSLVALFYQLVVNDWWILMQAVVYTSNEAARIFFISFYCLQVLIVFSVCTAFVVNAYIDMHEFNLKAQGKVESARPAKDEISQPESSSAAPPIVAGKNQNKAAPSDASAGVFTMSSNAAFGSGASIPLDSQLSAASEGQILQRIRRRATSVGMNVKLERTSGMVNTLQTMFADQLESQEELNTIEAVDD